MKNKKTVYELAQEMAYFYMGSDRRGNVEIGFDSNGNPSFNDSGYPKGRPAIVTVVKPKGEILRMWGVDDPFNKKEVIEAFHGKIKEIIGYRKTGQ